ncbi:sugar nucleotide-binding protein [Streptomyces atrovirens]|uniref:Sugar nucleotide-binding protein n=1 Tax=Streptomyces atrovirens TaxID=285556 RepID=A0ABW0E362_9ACTN
MRPAAAPVRRSRPARRGAPRWTRSPASAPSANLNSTAPGRSRRTATTRAAPSTGPRPATGSATARAAGLAGTVARHRDHPTGPRTACSRSELAGERAVSEEPPDASAVVRTPWLHGLHGTNFVRTMISLEPRRPTVDVLDDQRGSPPGARTSPSAQPASGPAPATARTARRR